MSRSAELGDGADDEDGAQAAREAARSAERGRSIGFLGKSEPEE
jgi:hypothetical protein